MIYPGAASMTEEEAIEYASRYTDIETMVDEMTIKYITGAENIDSYDTFIQNLYDYGLQSCLDIKQASYDRYLERAD